MKYFSLIFFIFLAADFYAQHEKIFVLDPYIQFQLLKPKTRDIEQKFDTSLKVTDINVFESYVEWRFYPNWGSKLIAKNTSELLREHPKQYPKSKTDSTYYIVPGLEWEFKKKIDDKMLLEIKKELPVTKKTEATITDYNLIRNELHKINAFLDSTDVDNYKISDNFYKILKNYPGTHQVLFDELVGAGWSYSPGGFDLYWYTRLYVIDMDSRKLCFYKYFKNMGNYSEYYKAPDINPLENKMIKTYLKFLKKNKQYLEKLNKPKN